MALRSIQRISMADEATQQLRQEIVSGRYAIGDKFGTEMELGERLGVGRSTIREELRTLHAMGFLEIRRGLGAFVSKTSDDTNETVQRWFAEHEPQLEDYMEVRLVLDSLAVRLAAERATKQDVADIAEVLTAFDRALERSDVVELAATDEAFHLRIAKAARNRLITALSHHLAEVLRPYRLKSFATPEYAQNALEPHRKIYRAIIEGNGEAGATEMARHVEISLVDIHSAVAARKAAPTTP